MLSGDGEAGNNRARATTLWWCVSPVLFTNIGDSDLVRVFLTT